MYGGSISGNSARYGGGVSLDNGENGAVFNMYGGEITGNTATSSGGGGVYVNRYSTFHMYGGSITDNLNTASEDCGGGVRVSQDGTFTVSGKVNITGNKYTDNTASNVYLTSDKAIQIVGELDASAKIGVTAKNVNTGEHVTVATLSEGAAYIEGTIISDRTGGYAIKAKGNNINLYNGLPHEHPICGKMCAHTGSETHGDLTWTPLTSKNGQPYAGSTKLGTGNFNATEGYVLPAGHYYLSTELTLDKPLLIKKGVYLCLNGQTLSVQSSNSAVIIDTGCDLTLCDCSAAQTGKITHAASATGRGVYMGASNSASYNGSFTMYGGSITDNRITGGSGAGVYMKGKGTFNMHGGSITGNTTEGSATGGVYVSGGTFHMTGGSITATGGGVKVDGQGTFNMSGDAVISNNNAYGGGVYVGSGGKFDMSGNAAITGNTVSNYGGGVYVYGETEATAATFTMSGNASITGNSADYGGGVLVWKYGRFTMTGGSITGNNVSTAGGGVYVINYDATMTVSGNVQITDNWKNGTKNADGVYEQGEKGSANNFYLSGNRDNRTEQQTVTIGTDGLTENARIGIITNNTPTAEAPIKIATGATGDLDYYTTIFTPDEADRGYVVTKDGTNLVLSAHQHSWTYAQGDTTDTITATCKDTTCANRDGGSVRISASDATYDRSAKAATVTASGDWKGDAANSIAVKYIGRNGTDYDSTSAPTDAGEYTASITLKGADGQTATASVEYKITKATPQASNFNITLPGNLVYDCGETGYLRNAG